MYETCISDHMNTHHVVVCTCITARYTVLCFIPFQNGGRMTLLPWLRFPFSFVITSTYAVPSPRQKKKKKKNYARAWGGASAAPFVIANVWTTWTFNVTH